MRKAQYICLVGSIGLISADRIDLLLRSAPFTLTPFLVLSPLVVLFSLLSKGLAGTPHLTITPPIQRQIPFLAASSLFLLLSLISVALGMDPERGIVAFADLLLVCILGYCISMRILVDLEPEKLIVRSVTFAVLVYTFFCVGQVIAWTHGMVMAQEPTSWVESLFAPQPLWVFAPRLSGATVDPNRAGFVLVMYIALLDKFAAKSRYTFMLHLVVAVLVLLTLSRSAMLCWFVYYFFSRNFWKLFTSRRVVVWLTIIAIASSLGYFFYREQLNDLSEAWNISEAVSDRFTLDQGSSGGDHIALIRRGVDTWLSSTHTAIIGIGFAAAPKVLTDFFGTNKHGNFHSLYLTVLAELGFFAFVTLMFILGYPVYGRQGSVACIAAIVIFNVTYQSLMEPLFWVILALLWSFERRGGAKHQPLVLSSVPAS
jgi:hypothetical protein